MQRPVVFAALLFTALLLAANAAGAEHIGDYPLDDIPRVLSPGDALPCAREGLVRYRGELIRYQRPVQVYRGFKPRLVAFERIAVDTAREVYGRAPRQLWHLGAHSCRRIRRYPDWVSEHALGNALDVAGFDFAALPRGSALPEGLPRRLRRAFSVRLLSHWDGKHGAAAVHSRFLRLLAQRVIERPDIFRTVLGPAWPGHKNHFHFDCAPYRVVEVF